ncbi:hypothetical protein A1O3_10263 [Capronia epimyces CBS 606.96]|uniref:Uncharacterized protein n=1 Tax=Capronia epimyces CBS 606.96 TaxID=1182542 RepID=W9XIC9_9EURO|nr:uncharacterized protein A1O3_10263 [Capronia epimyces CBS 606.96]EXJ77105.1 hypothetical protein A1O3_10263 [Capronia epimyces CBS 606.96]
MGPKRTRHQKNQQDKTKRSELRRRFGGLDIDQKDNATSDTQSAAAPTAAPARHPTHGPTTIEISKFPLVERWEQIEEAERASISRRHKARTGPFAFEPEYLPVQIHAAVPVHGSFTREIESDIVKCNTIEAIKDIAKSSLPLEFKRSNMKLNETKFAGIMTYGPTTEFSTRTVNNVTRGLFLDEDAYKKWWMTVNMTKREEGDMVKVAVVLWHEGEAKAKGVQLPDFWTEENTRVLGNMLERLDWPIFMSQSELEAGCRAYEKLQGQLQEARSDAILAGDWKDERKELKSEVTSLNGQLRRAVAANTKFSGQLMAISKAFDEGDMEKAGGLLTACKKAIEAKEKREAAEAEEEDEEAEGGEAVEEEEEDAYGPGDPSDDEWVPY